MDDEEDKKILRAGTVDFYTLSYYMSNCVTVDENAEQIKGNMMGGSKNPYLKASDRDWQIDPDGLRWTLNKLAFHYYNTSLMVVEKDSAHLIKLKMTARFTTTARAIFRAVVKILSSGKKSYCFQW